MKLMSCPRCWGVQSPCDKCESKGRIEDVRLSDNFMLSELLRSTTAARLKIPNDPTPMSLVRMSLLTRNLLQPARNLLGPLQVTSGYRAAALNSAVGGSTTSAHMKGYAADCIPSAHPLEDSMKYLWDHKDKLEFDQIILEPGWIHFGWKHPSSLAQRKQFLTKNGNAYLPWEPKKE